MQRPKIFYDVFMISPQLIINARTKNSISLKKITLSPTPENTSTSTSISPSPPPPLSDINNANSNVFEQLHKYQQCKKCKHLPPISPFSFFHFSSKNNFCVWGEWVLNPSPHSHYIICHAMLSAANLLC